VVVQNQVAAVKAKAEVLPRAEVQSQAAKSRIFPENGLEKEG
jgi:hypothetical protein